MLSSSYALEFIAKSEEYVKTHTPPPFIQDVPLSERPHTIIFCCADGRVNPLALFGLGLTDAIVIRNAGCGIPRMINDLFLLDQFADLREILIISHTDCGLTHVTDDGVRDSLKRRVPGHDEEIDSIYVGSFKVYSDRVKSDANYIRNHPLVRKELADNIYGAVYDIKTGKVTRIEV
ncbi:carbonic anhydrase [Xylariaceae sp. FL1651]|nr:carbonic anhydrase [Xylariaceae sp. FL1651]